MEQFFQSYGNWITLGAMFMALISVHILSIGHARYDRGSGSPPEAIAREDKLESRE